MRNYKKKSAVARLIIIRHQTPSVTALTRYRSDKQVRFAYQDDLVLYRIN